MPRFKCLCTCLIFATVTAMVGVKSVSASPLLFATQSAFEGAAAEAFDRGDMPKAFDLAQNIIRSEGSASLKALYIAGYCLGRGVCGAPQDSLAAVHYMSLAGKGGYAAALFTLAVDPEFGASRLTPDERVALLIRASESLHPAALMNLGVAYGRGDGVEKDPVAARELYRQAAELGYGPAAFSYGVMLITGEGGRQDVVLGLALIEMSDEVGYPLSAPWLVRFREELSRKRVAVDAAKLKWTQGLGSVSLAGSRSDMSY